MGRHTDPERIRHAQLSGAASGLRGMKYNQPDRWAGLADTWPELAERLERILELVDWG